MKHGLLVLALAGLLCVGLTACSTGNNSAAPNGGNTGNSGSSETGGQTQGNDTANGGSSSTGGQTAGGGSYNNGTGQVGDLNQDEIGNGGGAADDNMNTQAQARRSANMRRTAYDYLNDGKYEAGEDGMIRERSNLGKDLTQGARDLIRDAKDLGRDMARDVGDAARSAGQAAKDTGNAVKETIQDKLD